MPKSKRLDLLAPWLKEWPAGDRDAFERALVPGDGCDFVLTPACTECGLAAHWGHDHRNNNICVY